MEVLRLRPPAPVSIPHANTSQDLYNHWTIPPNSIIIMNLFAANQDPARFPDPQTFNPDRHWDHVMHRKDVFTQSVDDRPHLSFSTGRRVCVGIHLAERSMFMAVSMMLACFKFDRMSSEWIDTETPRDIYSAVLTPCHYKVRIVFRHDHVSQFIKQ
jgi:cytochrome P450